MGVLSRFKPAEDHVVGTETATDANDPVGRMGRWSAQQQAVFDWFKQAEGNLIVRARAGTGKTTTIIEGIRFAPESSILLCAFNKRIAEELNSRLSNPRAQAKTLHALGFAAIRANVRRVKVLNGNERADALSAAAYKAQGKKVELPREILRLTSLVHTKGREMMPLHATPALLTELALRFGYEPDEHWNGTWTVDHIAALAHVAMGIARDESDFSGGGIDYADMIYLPLVKDWLRPEYDLVVVDEAQDMTLAQLTMCLRVNRGRMCVVGDDRQAVYGFRGADSGSLDRLKKQLKATELPLNVTYRCGKAIVRQAQALVPDIAAHESNGPGQIRHISTLDELIEGVEPGDFVLSRINAPLVTLTLMLLGKRKRAYMAGRDIGAGIESVLRGLKLPPGSSVDVLMTHLDAWRSKRSTMLAARGLVELADRVRDQAEMIEALAHDALDADDVLAQARHLFRDTQEADAIMCSSVHKAKGLEAKRVWVLADTFYRRGVTPEEQNIEYVAITRAKDVLTYVSAQGE